MLFFHIFLCLILIINILIIREYLGLLIYLFCSFILNLVFSERNKRSGRQHPVSTRRMVALYDYDPRESSPNVDVEVLMEFILSGLFLPLTVSSHKLLILRWLAWMSASVIATKFIFSLFSLLLRLQCGLYFLCYCSFRCHMAALKVKFWLKRKLKFCYYLHTVMSFQSCMTFFCELIILKLKCEISVPNRI